MHLSNRNPLGSVLPSTLLLGEVPRSRRPARALLPPPLHLPPLQLGSELRIGQTPHPPLLAPFPLLALLLLLVFFLLLALLLLLGLLGLPLGLLLGPSLGFPLGPSLGFPLGPLLVLGLLRTLARRPASLPSPLAVVIPESLVSSLLLSWPLPGGLGRLLQLLRACALPQPPELLPALREEGVQVPRVFVLEGALEAEMSAAVEPARKARRSGDVPGSRGRARRRGRERQ